MAHKQWDVSHQGESWYLHEFCWSQSADIFSDPLSIPVGLAVQQFEFPSNPWVKQNSEIKWSTHSHTAGKWQIGDLNTGLPSSATPVLATFPTTQPVNNTETKWKTELSVLNFPGKGDLWLESVTRNSTEHVLNKLHWVSVDVHQFWRKQEKVPNGCDRSTWHTLHSDLSRLTRGLILFCSVFFCLLIGFWPEKNFWRNLMEKHTYSWYYTMFLILIPHKAP